MVVHKSTCTVKSNQKEVMRSLCGLLYYNEGKTTEDWVQVTCKLCLKLREKERDIQKRHLHDQQNLRSLQKFV